MSEIKIQVYNQFEKKLKTLSFSESLSVGQICELLDPDYEEKMLTLYLGDKVLVWSSSFKYIQEKYQVTSSKVFLFNFIYYTFVETQRHLQKNEEELRNLIEFDKLKVYHKEDQEFFKASEVHAIVRKHMERVTLRLNSETTRRLRENYRNPKNP